MLFLPSIDVVFLQIVGCSFLRNLVILSPFYIFMNYS